MQDHLIFIYNADAGFVNMAYDWLHKIINPKTYPCSLCTLTYGHFGEKKEWKAFVNQHDFTAEFLHKDEFEKKYPFEKVELPCILMKRKDKISSFFKAEELNSLTSLHELMSNIIDKRKRFSSVRS